MARTRLLQSIVQLARDVAEAEARGVEVERLDDERQAHKVSRRAVIVGAGAAAGALMLPRVARAASPRIAVVGAGISGLSAALTLADAGVASTVYEASGR